MAQKIPVTPVTRLLQKEKVPFVPHLYKYEEKGGTEVASKSLGENEHNIIKTLVLQDHEEHTFIVLMHGNKQVSLKNMARFLQKPHVKMCSPQQATKATGYLVGGTSPFATKNKIPIYCEKSILEIKQIWLNAGKRGFLIQVAIDDVVKLLNPVTVEVAIDA